jgi:cell wall-associated NlpC family hydrolase
MSRPKTTPRAVLRAREMIRAPYRHLGRNRQGIDCLGLMFHALDLDEAAYGEVLEAHELAGGYYSGSRWVYDRNDPRIRESCRILLSALTKHLLTCRMDDLRAGDVLLISFKSGKDGLGDHIGLYAGDGKMIHADLRRGVEEVVIPEKLWRRVIGVYRKAE